MNAGRARAAWRLNMAQRSCVFVPVVRKRLASAAAARGSALTLPAAITFNCIIAAYSRMIAPVTAAAIDGPTEIKP